MNLFSNRNSHTNHLGPPLFWIFIPPFILKLQPQQFTQHFFIAFNYTCLFLNNQHYLHYRSDLYLHYKYPHISFLPPFKLIPPLLTCTTMWSSWQSQRPRSGLALPGPRIAQDRTGIGNIKVEIEISLSRWIFLSWTGTRSQTISHSILKSQGDFSFHFVVSLLISVRSPINSLQLPFKQPL